MLNLINKLFQRTKPQIVQTASADGIDYCYLTDLNLLDKQLTQDIVDYADLCINSLTPLPGVVSSVTEIDKVIDTYSNQSELTETARRFNAINTDKPKTLVNYFKRYYLNDSLTSRILSKLPKSIRKTNFEIVLIVTNYGTPLHIDVCDQAILLCPILTNNEITSFWEVKDSFKDDHEFILNAFADPDKVEKKLDVVFRPGESWLLNVSKIHAVEPTTNTPSNNRVIITFRWFDGTDINDILKWFQVK